MHNNKIQHILAIFKQIFSSIAVFGTKAIAIAGLKRYNSEHSKTDFRKHSLIGWGSEFGFRVPLNDFI